MRMLCSFGPREVEAPGDVQAELTRALEVCVQDSAERCKRNTEVSEF